MTTAKELAARLRSDAASFRRNADSAVRMSGPTAVLGEAGSLRKAADNFEEAADFIEAAQPVPGAVTDEMVERAAEAIVKNHSPNWEHLTEKSRDFWRKDARDALEAALAAPVAGASGEAFGWETEAEWKLEQRAVNCNSQWRQYCLAVALYASPQGDKALRDALERITEAEEFHHGSGVVDYRPVLDADAMYDIAFEALAALSPSPDKPASGDLEWAVERWKAEVANRPLKNIHRSALDTTWRQVMRHFDGDPEALCGPSHDDLVAANPELFRAKDEPASDANELAELRAEVERLTQERNETATKGLEWAEKALAAEARLAASSDKPASEPLELINDHLPTEADKPAASSTLVPAVGDIAYLRVRIDTDPKDGWCFCTPASHPDDLANGLSLFDDSQQTFGYISANGAASPDTQGTPEAWELEAAAVFMDHVDDDDTGSVHRVAAFLRRVASLTSTAEQGEAK